MLRWIVAILVLIVIVAFALSNQQVVQVGLWPTGVEIEVPLSWAVLAASAVAFIIGALMTWGGKLSAKSRARRAERSVAQLQDQVAILRAQMASRSTGTAVLAPPGT